MKKLFKTTLLLFALLLPATAMAYSFEVDGIAYLTDLFDDYAMVTDWGDEGKTYSGNVTIPESVTHDGTTYPVTRINAYAFSNSAGLTSVTIPETITEIGDHAFEFCTGLSEVIIPATVTSLGARAFDGCTGLTSIDIPANVTEIGIWAFLNCTNLIDVYWHYADPSTVSLGGFIFSLEDENYSPRTLHVPAGSEAAYKDTDLAEYFGQIVGM